MTSLFSFFLFLFMLAIACFGPMVLKKYIRPKDGKRYDTMSEKFAMCGVAVSLIIYLYLLYG